MKLIEALQELEAGKKLRGLDWNKNQYIRLINGRIICDLGLAYGVDEIVGADLTRDLKFEVVDEGKLITKREFYEASNQAITDRSTGSLGTYRDALAKLLGF